MQFYSYSRSQQFNELKNTVRKIVPGKWTMLTGSFGVFYEWLVKEHPDIIKQAAEIADDIHLWRNSHDVLRQIWEQIFRH